MRIELGTSTILVWCSSFWANLVNLVMGSLNCLLLIQHLILGLRAWLYENPKVSRSQVNAKLSKKENIRLKWQRSPDQSSIQVTFCCWIFFHVVKPLMPILKISSSLWKPRMIDEMRCNIPVVTRLIFKYHPILASFCSCSKLYKIATGKCIRFLHIVWRQYHV